MTTPMRRLTDDELIANYRTAYHDELYVLQARYEREARRRDRVNGDHALWNRIRGVHADLTAYPEEIQRRSRWWFTEEGHRA